MEHNFQCPYPELVNEFAAWKWEGAPLPSQDVVARSIMYAYITGEPIPRELLGVLTYAFEALRQGHDSPLFEIASIDTDEGRRVTRKTHPEAAQLEYYAVSYVRTCKRTGWDEKPVKTICDAYGVSRTAYYNWEKKYPTAPDTRSKDDLSRILDCASLYQVKRKL